MTNTNILIAEDEKALASALAEKLSRENYTTTVVANGEEALVALKKKKFDLVLLDLVMPQKNGFEVLEELKEDSELRVVPVIILSNLGEDENIKKALRLGAVDYFVKADHPIAEVVEKVKEQLMKSR
jgi:DNA-binding response OmpR family regulator